MDTYHFTWTSSSPASCADGIDMLQQAKKSRVKQITRCITEYREAFVARHNARACICRCDRLSYGTDADATCRARRQRNLTGAETGGLFAATVPNLHVRTGNFKVTLEIVKKVLHEEFPQWLLRPQVTRALFEKAGMETLFGMGAKLTKMEDDSFGRETTPEESWNHVKNMYLIGDCPLKYAKHKIRSHQYFDFALCTQQRFEFTFRKFVLQKF